MLGSRSVSEEAVSGTALSGEKTSRVGPSSWPRSRPHPAFEAEQCLRAQILAAWVERGMFMKQTRPSGPLLPASLLSLSAEISRSTSSTTMSCTNRSANRSGAEGRALGMQGDGTIPADDITFTQRIAGLCSVSLNPAVLEHNHCDI